MPPKNYNKALLEALFEVLLDLRKEASWGTIRKWKDNFKEDIDKVWFSPQGKCEG